MHCDSSGLGVLVPPLVLLPPCSCWNIPHTVTHLGACYLGVAWRTLLDISHWFGCVFFNLSIILIIVWIDKWTVSAFYLCVTLHVNKHVCQGSEFLIRSAFYILEYTFHICTLACDAQSWIFWMHLFIVDNNILVKHVHSWCYLE